VNEPFDLPLRFLRLFLETLDNEIGEETVGMALELGNLPASIANPQAVSRFTSLSAADVYARLQKALRLYYGRGARGTLMRIGRLMWGRKLEDATFQEKAHAQMIHSLPNTLRRKQALQLLIHFMRDKGRGLSLHTLDLDLMLVDQASPTTISQKESSPICFVTQGLIEESLFWATGRETDVEEISCRAAGGNACEFKIRVGGK
jgi:predicted hydrocarbon binding protein